MLDGLGHFVEIDVEDDRYAVPTLRLIVAAEDLCARELAAKVMGESAHHRRVDVRSGDRRIVVLARRAPAAPRNAPRSAPGNAMRDAAVGQQS